jgi:hypothetical protein
MISTPEVLHLRKLEFSPKDFALRAGRYSTGTVSKRVFWQLFERKRQPAIIFEEAAQATEARVSHAPTKKCRPVASASWARNSGQDAVDSMMHVIGIERSSWILFVFSAILLYHLGNKLNLKFCLGFLLCRPKA